jgi:hypothetical protein
MFPCIVLAHPYLCPAGMDEGRNPPFFLIHWNTGQDFPFCITLSDDSEGCLAWNLKHVELVHMSQSQIVLIDEVRKIIIMALQSFVGPRKLFQFLYRTPWTGDQPVARPLATHRATQTQNK